MNENNRKPIWKQKWVSVVGWGLGIVVSYWVLYPMLLILLGDMGLPYESMPERLQEAFQFSVAPIVWLAESCPPYQQLLNLIDELIPDR